jgi:hypothetical protein
MRGFACVLAAFVLLAVAGAGQDTGWRSPAADFGAFHNPWNAYQDDDLWATALPDQTHTYWGYDLSVPPGGTIRGIEVRLDAWRWPAGVPWAAYLEVQLSWDGGANWTAPYTAGPLTASEATWILGGPNDGWGRTWTAAELGPDRFRVRLTARQGREVRLDWVAVRVYFAAGLSLGLSTATVNLGTLTLADYDRGYRDWDDLQRVKLSAYASWVLYIAAATSTWSYTGDFADPKKPCGHLLWRVALPPEGPVGRYNSVFTPLSTAEMEVASGSAGEALLSLAFRLLVDYETTIPGAYTLHFRYTLVVP